MSNPVLQALLVADQIYQDQATGKFVICGIFGTIYFHPNEVPKPNPEQQGAESGAGPVPGVADQRSADGSSVRPGSPPPVQQLPIQRLIRAGSPYAYVSLTEVRGHRNFQLRYVDLKENLEIFATQFAVDCRDPLETIQLSFPLPPLPVLHEGVFALELLCEGELLGSHRILTKRQAGP